MLTDNDNATIHAELNAPDAGESRINRMIRESFASFEPLESGLRYLLLTDRYEMPSNIDQPSTAANDIALPSETMAITPAMEKEHIGYIGVRKKSGELAGIEHQGAFVCRSERALTSAIINWCEHAETFDIRRVNFSSILQMLRRKIPCANDAMAYVLTMEKRQEIQTVAKLGRGDRGIWSRTGIDR